MKKRVNFLKLVLILFLMFVSTNIVLAFKGPTTAPGTSGTASVDKGEYGNSFSTILTKLDEIYNKLNFLQTSAVMNGACGSASGSSYVSAPSTNLCSVGTASSISGSGPWTWTCAGVNGGTTSGTCTATKQCTANSYTQCSGNDRYYYNSCNQIGSIAQDCPAYCSGNACVACTSNAHCGASQTCSGGTCVSSCTANAYTQCYGNDRYYYNSCGQLGSMVQDCSAYCSGNTCVACTSDSHCSGGSSCVSGTCVAPVNCTTSAGVTINSGSGKWLYRYNSNSSCSSYYGYRSCTNGSLSGDASLIYESCVSKPVGTISISGPTNLAVNKCSQYTISTSKIVGSLTHYASGASNCYDSATGKYGMAWNTQGTKVYTVSGVDEVGYTVQGSITVTVTPSTPVGTISISGSTNLAVNKCSQYTISTSKIVGSLTHNTSGASNCYDSTTGKYGIVWSTQGTKVYTVSGVDEVGQTVQGSITVTVTSPSYTNCTLDGVTVTHGSSRMFYFYSSSPTCSSYGQSRACNNGTLSGTATYKFANCSYVAVPMLSEISASTMNYAAAVQYCSNLSGPMNYGIYTVGQVGVNSGLSYTDWHLPTRSEIQAFYGKTTSTTFLWTSTQSSSADFYYIERLSGTHTNTHAYKTELRNVRCVR